MRGRLMGYAGGLISAAALGACAAQGGAGGEVAATSVAPASTAAAPAASPVLTGASIATMADQYARPRRGATPAAGASAWVAPAPAPAFVAAAPLPPADPPAPAPAAVANRRPASPPVDAASLVRPEAAAPEAAPPAATRDPAVRARGLALFNQFTCSACHAFADAGAGGAIGPTLDNPQLTKQAVIAVVTDGRGAMPSFGGQMSEAEVAALADYLVQFARK